jgi:hypothetical protein
MGDGRDLDRRARRRQGSVDSDAEMIVNQPAAPNPAAECSKIT